MSGMHRPDEGGQLALLDAMVFFAVSAMICAAMVSQAVSQTQALREDVLDGPATDELLNAFLSASVGAVIYLDGLDAELTGDERFCEALFLVSAMILDGQGSGSLGELLSFCGRVLADLCAPWSSTLMLSALDDGHMVLLVEVGEQASADADKYAASQSLGEYGGKGLVATLVLFPALVLHGLGV